MSSYDAGRKPFNHDESRGKWSHPTDFIFASVGHAFKADTILFMPVVLFRQLGYYAIIPYFLVLAMCVVPIIFIQSFLGQFSGTGFISVFRLAPLFKGVGYVSLAFNIITLAYYSIFSVIPLLSLSYILRPTIPWSCDGATEWMNPDTDRISICELNQTFDEMNFRLQVPSAEFFETKMTFTRHVLEPGFSWEMFLCSSLVWIVVVFMSLRPIETIGRFARYTCFAVLGIMCLLFFRFLLLPGAFTGLMQFYKPFGAAYPDGWFMLPYVALSTLGPGWGSIITMASFNDFKANIYSFSWIVSLLQLAVLLGVTFLAMLMTGFLFSTLGEDVQRDLVDEFLFIPTGLTLIELPHFWSLLFFGMLLLGSLHLLVVQLTSVLTTLFDEYEVLRANKRAVKLASGGILAGISCFFCSNDGLGLLALLAKSAVITQMLLNLLLLLVVLWVYGREHFQRDVFFMTRRVYPTLMVNIVRFVSPLFLFLGSLVGLLLTARHVFQYFSVEIFSTLIVLTAIPWCLIPIWCIYKVMQTKGRFGLRLRRSVRPVNWYPGDPVYKLRYEEHFGNLEVSLQLTPPVAGADEN